MRQATIRPVADSLMQWDLTPASGLGCTKIDEDVDEYNGNEDYIRSINVGEIARVRLAPVPVDLQESLQVTVRARVAADVPLDCEARINLGFYINGALVSEINGDDLHSGRWFYHEWTSEDWVIDVGQTVELAFINGCVQTEPPSFGLRVYITAAELKIVYEQKPGVFISMAPVETVFTVLPIPDTVFNGPPVPAIEP